ncbi:Sulfotransferase family protein [Loktanella fryxellensis]|uniref:Sulfotransferase family protein n=1 Tax=Loktanella fryxellensis TaxID=245187 RepID=A0A1H8HA96_9RHOB|nr:sulfotransferase [Loktanella fryxellensis]SEN52687.1 Sulfotransferase family protein [Loktanella fryxellensis]
MRHGPDYRYVFVGGLHRSGTSLTARLIAAMPGAGAIRTAPVPENEGVYLQGAIPHHAQSGVPMAFATDPAQHLTEDHPLNRLETRQRLEADWTPWYPHDCRWRLEKSPVNLTRMRLLQQLFPMAHFVVVLRHPEAVAAAVAKWVDQPSQALIDHWLAAHDQLAGDLPYLHAVTVIRYEDLTRDPARMQRGLAAFLDLTAPSALEEVIADRNDLYAGACRLSAPQAARASAWGYGPDGAVDRGWHAPVQHPLRDVREAAVRAWSAE